MSQTSSRWRRQRDGSLQSLTIGADGGSCGSGGGGRSPSRTPPSGCRGRLCLTSSRLVVCRPRVANLTAATVLYEYFYMYFDYSCTQLTPALQGWDKTDSDICS